MPLPSYLILGSATSGRRGLVFNTLKNADGEGMNAVFISKSESRSEFDAKLESLSNVRLFQYEDMGRLSEKLIDLQHHSSVHVLASTHVHLSHEICAEMIMIRGCGREIEKLAASLKRLKGVLKAELTAGSMGNALR